MASTGLVDLFVVYQFIRRLATPFKKWKAYETGVIDERGNILVKPNDRNREQNEAFKVFDVMILKLKRLLEKIPFGKTRLASYAAALYLVKEDWESKTEQEILSESNDKLADYIKLYKLEDFGRMMEEMPTMNAGSGNIAGMGYGGPNDVKVTKKKQKSYKQMNKIEAEKYHSGVKSYVNQRFQNWMV